MREQRDHVPGQVPTRSLPIAWLISDPLQTVLFPPFVLLTLFFTFKPGLEPVGFYGLPSLSGSSGKAPAVSRCFFYRFS